jgi:hypothetical protein
MTRVTNHLRDHMERQIMKDLPSRDYIKEIHALVQSIIAEHMPLGVGAIYGNPDMHGYLREVSINVRVGNNPVPMHKSGSFDQRCDLVYGLKQSLTIRMDDAENAGRLPEGSLYREIVTKLHAAGLVAAYFTQEELRVSVRNRVRANLAAAKTFKQLYEILEPELHHYIPKNEAKMQLPACVAPVVDDLRKLGAVLPEVPKAAG